MKQQQNTTHLEDYEPYPWHIKNLSLDIDLDESNTIVKSSFDLEAKNSEANEIVLNGAKLELLEISIDGEKLSDSGYKLDGERLTIKEVNKTQLNISTVCKINPIKNLELEGLYYSEGMFCTQCEAEGFRKITYYPDRPDCPSLFTCKLTADKTKYPVLLSNGNLVNSGESGDQHWVVWQDPFPKPSYLFALIGGDLAYSEDFYITSSGRKVTLRIYSDHMHSARHAFAMESLKKSMKWEEDVFGLEYDLDIFMIAAVDDFNFGAMENKGLNIFNSNYILCDEKFTTDAEKIQIESIIAHEYFHNWTGNRVTLKNWFQLTLKEGLTVFRDQEFTSDVRLGDVKRIDDIKQLRTYQFPEDAGPLAHFPIPDAYVDMNNFYTLTVYEKGAEIVRMLYSILGRDKFIKAINQYLKENDGKGVTVSDFIRPMEALSGLNLDKFYRWYRQKGTPEVTVSFKYHQQDSKYVVSCEQRNPASSKIGIKDPLPIPLKIGLIGKSSGEEIPVRTDHPKYFAETGIFLLEEETDTLELSDVTEDVVLSLNRGFTAPVNLKGLNDSDSTRVLAENDSDMFNRWNAVEDIFRNEIDRSETALINEEPYQVGEHISPIIQNVLSDYDRDMNYTALLLSMPSIAEVVSYHKSFDPDVFSEAYERVFKETFTPFQDNISELFNKLRSKKDFQDENDLIATRLLKNHILGMLIRLDHHQYMNLALSQYKQTENITDKVSALFQIAKYENKQRNTILNDFYGLYSDYKPLLYKWFASQASIKSESVFEDISHLTKHPKFFYTTPNCVRSVFGALTSNFEYFHHSSGKGYNLLKGAIINVNQINPSLAALLTKRFNFLNKINRERTELCRDCLNEIRGVSGISPSVLEIINIISQID